MTEAEARAQYDSAIAALQDHQQKEVALREAFSKARAAYVAELQKRPPTEDELLFGMAKCACGAALAYRKVGDEQAWECSDILLGIAKPKGHPESKVHTAPLPFAFYDVKTDRTRGAGRQRTPWSPPRCFSCSS